MLFLSITFYRRYRSQLAILGLFLSSPWIFPPLPTLAAANQRGEEVSRVETFLSSAFIEQNQEPLYFPSTAVRSARYEIIVPATAYSSTPDQTDDTPFITASGTRVRWGVVAANFLPLGTQIRLPDYYGEQIFVVEDRMNDRYDYRLDIWMETREQAKQWGIKRVRVEVL